MLKKVLMVALIGFMVFASLNQAQTTHCPSDYEGFLQPRLEVGMRARVTLDGSGNRLRETASANAAQVGVLPPATEFEVIGGPSCDAASSIIWWQIRTDGNIEAWTAEGLPDSGYFLEPLNTIAATPSLSPSPRPSSTATASPTAVSLAPLNLPELSVISPENIGSIEVLGQIPRTGRAISVFMSPNMEYLFVWSVTQSGGDYANVYRFPELQAVTQGVPLDSNQSEPLFSADSRLMVAVGNTYLSYYEIGSTEFVMDNGDRFRFVGHADLSATGILASSFSPPDNEPTDFQLCFIDTLGESYAPANSICIPQDKSTWLVRFIPNSNQVFVGKTDSLELYDALNAELLDSFNYGIASWGTMEILPNSQENGALPTIFLSRDGFVLSVNLETGEEHNYLSGQGKTVREIMFNADASQMIFVVPTSNIPDVLVVDVASREIIHQDALYGGENTAYSPAANLAFINNEIYETLSWQMLLKLTGHHHIIGFSPDGTLLFVTNTEENVFEVYGVSSS
jgi:hypothetical protein